MLFIYRARQLSIQYQMRMSLKGDEKEFEKLTLSLEEYNACKFEKHEIIYNGKLYDVKSVYIIDNSVELLAEHDIEEEKVIKEMNDFVAGEKDSRSTIPLHLKTFSTLHYLLPAGTYKYFANSTEITYPAIFQLSYENQESDIPSPPPKLI